MRWDSRSLDYDEDIERALEQGAILCHDCGEPIYEGEDYYDIGCHIYCEKCIEAFKMTHWEARRL